MGKKLLKTHKVDFKDEEVRFAWYTVVTMFNHERKVADALRKRFESMGAGDKLKEVFVPIREWEEVSYGKIKKDGTRTKRTLKKSENVLDSGYIFINMIMDNDTWNIVRQTSNVAGWLNADGRPSPVPAEDVVKFKQMIADAENNQDSKPTDVKIGDHVKVKSGPFEGTEGKIADIVEDTAFIEMTNGMKLDISPTVLEVI